MITGTRNVVEVAADCGVRRVVLSSTIGTMYMDPRRDPDKPLDDSCWSDLEYCKRTKVRCKPPVNSTRPLSLSLAGESPLTPPIAELVLLREDDRGAGRVGGGEGARAGLGGGDPRGGAGRDAAARDEHQHLAHPQVPHRRGQGVRQRVARLRARQGRRRGARQGAPGPGRRGPPLRLRREDAAPRRALPDPRRPLPGVPHPHKVRY